MSKKKIKGVQKKSRKKTHPIQQGNTLLIKIYIIQKQLISLTQKKKNKNEPNPG